MEVNGEDTWSLEVGCTGETCQELSCRFQGNGRDHLRKEVGPSFSWGTGTNQASPLNGWHRWFSTGSSVCFAGIYSLKVFIFFWSRKVFYWMERIFWLKIICKRNRILIHITLPCAPTYLILPLLVIHAFWWTWGPALLTIPRCLRTTTASLYVPCMHKGCPHRLFT